MIPLIDEPCWTPHRKILTPEQTQLPWLQSFGFQTSGKAETPLATHFHPGCMEIVFLLKGFQMYETFGHLFRLTGYDVFVARMEEPHSSGDSPEQISEPEDLLYLPFKGCPGYSAGTPPWRASSEKLFSAWHPPTRSPRHWGRSFSPAAFTV